MKLLVEPTKDVMHICNGKIRGISDPQYTFTKMDLVKTFGDDVRPNRAYSLGRFVQETAKDRSTEDITFKFVFRKWPTLVILELWFFSFLPQQNELNTFHRISICECPLFFSFQNLHFRPIVTEWKSFDANMPRLTNAPFKRFFTLSSNKIQCGVAYLGCCCCLTSITKVFNTQPKHLNSALFNSFTQDLIESHLYFVE